MEIFFFLIAAAVVGYLHHSKEKSSTFKGAGQKDDGFSEFEETETKKPEFAETFNEAFLALASYVIKSDDDIASVELQRVRNYFRTYYPSQEESYFDRLNSYIEKEIDINEVCKVILNAEFQDKFQMMSQLFNIASADSHIFISEYVALYDIFNSLNLPNLTFISIRGLFNVSFTQKEIADFKENSFKKKMENWHQMHAETEQQRRQRQQQQQQQEQQYRQEQKKYQEQQRKQKEKYKQEQSGQKKQSYNNYYQKKSTFNSKKTTSKLENAYNILGLKKGATLKEIKKAFRKLAHQHHPDKVAHLGEGSVRQAEVVFRKIKDAYELVIRSLK